MFKPRIVCGGIFQIPIPLGSIKCLDESESPLFFESSRISKLFPNDNGLSWNKLVKKIIHTRSDMSGYIESFHSIPDTIDSDIDKHIDIIDKAIGPTILYMTYIRLMEFVLSRNIPVVKTNSFPNGLFFQSYWTSPIKEKTSEETETWMAYTTQSLHAEILMCFLTLSLLYHTLGTMMNRKKNKSLINDVTSHYYTSMMICKIALTQYKKRTHVKLYDLELYDHTKNLILNEHQLLVFIELVYKLAHVSILLSNIKYIRTEDLEKYFPEEDTFKWIRRDIPQHGDYITITGGGYDTLLIYQKLHFSIAIEIINILVFLREETIVHISNIYELVEKAMNSLKIYTFIEFLILLNFFIYDKPDEYTIVYTKYDDIRQQDVTIPINIIHRFLNFMMNFMILLATGFCSRHEITNLNSQMKLTMSTICQITYPLLNNNHYEILNEPIIPTEDDVNLDIDIKTSEILEPIIEKKMERMIDFLKDTKSMNDCIHLLLYNSFPSTLS